MTQPATIGALRDSGYQDRTVKDELRTNLLGKLERGEELFPGIVGFDEAVLPGLERGILAGHDLILLGERGQAKTRLVRAIVNLLDESIPVDRGVRDPRSPVPSDLRAMRRARRGARRHGAGPWIGRDDRYAEKLATPDTSVADLIGDVDPIRVAEGRYLSDELTIHYGMIPRTNRGIVAINELPDLPERIQVSLFNILEERDIQIRGYRIRLPLDLLVVATANPDDYTHRGRIVSPLKDRFGTQVRTHYPEELGDEIVIMDQEARTPAGDIPVRVPAFMKEIVAALTAELRRSPHINHRSGVSVRYSIGNVETLSAAAVRRAARAGEPEAVPRVCDLPAVLALLGGTRRVRHRRGGSRGRHPFPGHAHRRARGLPSPAVGVRLPAAPAPVRRRSHRRDIGPDARRATCSRSSAICPACRSCSTGWVSRRRVPASPLPRSSSSWRGSTSPGA